MHLAVSLLSYVVDLSMSMMTPRYLTDARQGILAPAILKFQSGSTLLYHNASHFSGENLRPSCIALASIFFSAVVICSYTMSSPMGPPWIAKSSAYAVICTLLPRSSCSSRLIFMLNNNRLRLLPCGVPFDRWLTLDVFPLKCTVPVRFVR